jgi:chromosome partitioning protein
MRGQKVLLADVDPQHSSHSAMSMRQAAGPAVEATTGGKLFHMKSAAALHYVDLMLIDCPAGLETSVYQAIQVADLCLVVTRPNYLDLASALSAINELRQLRKPALIVINQAPATREGCEASATSKAREALRFVKYPVAETALCSRVAYSKAISVGQSVEEFEPKGLAAREVAVLWREVARHWGISPKMNEGATTNISARNLAT